MNKKSLILIALLGLIILGLISGIVAVIASKKEKKEVKPPKIVLEKVYGIKIKTFPAPYPYVGRIPRVNR